MGTMVQIAKAMSAMVAAKPAQPNHAPYSRAAPPRDNNRGNIPRDSSRGRHMKAFVPLGNKERDRRSLSASRSPTPAERPPSR